MKIVCSSNMPYVQEAFKTLGDPLLRDGRAISANDVRDAELLAIRSTTKVTPELLEGSSVRFVGTATIGTDHMDIDYLEKHGIHWCYSPGCNATSVAEYITCALLTLANRHEFTLEGKTIGVVGVGNVGCRVVQKARALGMAVLQNDPPRQRSEPDGDFVSLDRVLAESDIITFHVPLTREGQDPTYQLADETLFERLKPGTVFINSARGPVVQTDALLAAIQRGTVSHTVIDTWEGEPSIRADLLEKVDLGTPHIAGYSFDGKVAGTVMVYQEACKFSGIDPTWTPDALLPPAPSPHVEIDAGRRTDEDVLLELTRHVYDIDTDDHAMRAGASSGMSAHFDGLRRNYPIRREFRYTQASLPGASDGLKRKVIALGFA